LAGCDLSVIIVHWNVIDLLCACLTSIEQVSEGDTTHRLQRLFGPPAQRATFEVIVVDNASNDGAVERLRREFPWVTVIPSQTNLGFTAGNNLGYAHSQGRYIYFLNPDTEIVDNAETGDSLWTLYRSVKTDATVGMAGPRLRYGDGTSQETRRRFPTPLTGFFESTWLGRLWPGNPWSRHMHMVDWPVDYQHDVDWIVGAAMLAPRTALDAVRIAGYEGPFDEGYFMYSEELDLCRRIKTAGWRVIYVPDALVIHHEGRSSEQVVAARHIHFNASKVRYYRKAFGHRWAGALRRYLLFEFRWQLWIERVKRVLGSKRDLRTARIEAYHRVLASGLEAQEGPDAGRAETQ
jgi:GT2 family glycosyltransferase